MPPLVWTSLAPFWLEIHRETRGAGPIRARVSPGDRPRVDVHLSREHAPSRRGGIADGVPARRPHHPRDLRTGGRGATASPLATSIPQDADAAGFLLRTLGSQTLQDHDVVLQLLFQRARVWESGLFSARYMTYAERHGRALRAEMDARRAEPAYHVELRAH